MAVNDVIEMFRMADLRARVLFLSSPWTAICSRRPVTTTSVGRSVSASPTKGPRVRDGPFDFVSIEIDVP